MMDKTLLDEMAAAALTGLLKSEDSDRTPLQTAKKAYQYAGAMMEVRQYKNDKNSNNTYSRIDAKNILTGIKEGLEYNGYMPEGAACMTMDYDGAWCIWETTDVYKNFNIGGWLASHVGELDSGKIKNSYYPDWEDGIIYL